MLTAMAGTDFSHSPGDELEVKNEVAEAWQDAGIAEIVEVTSKSRKKKSDE